MCWWNSRFVLLQELFGSFVVNKPVFIFQRKKKIKNEIRVALQSLKPSILFYPKYYLWIPIRGAIDVCHFAPYNSSHFRYKEALLFELIFQDIKEPGLVFVFLMQAVVGASCHTEISYFGLVNGGWIWNKTEVNIHRVFARQNSRSHLLNKIFFWKWCLNPLWEIQNISLLRHATIK